MRQRVRFITKAIFDSVQGSHGEVEGERKAFLNEREQGN